MREIVKLIKSDNNLVIDCGTKFPRKIIETELTMLTQQTSVEGYGRNARLNRESIPYAMYSIDETGRLCTLIGFLDRVVALLNKHNSAYEIVDRDMRFQSALVPDWSRLDNITFRTGQREALEIMLSNINGRINCPTGWGKSFVIGCLCRILPKARIAVATASREVLCGRLYPELLSQLSNVGICCSTKKVLGKRVMCYTLRSLPRSPHDEDILIVDEGHEASADGNSEILSQFLTTRLFGLSASWDRRGDGKNMRTEALFGPIRLDVSYMEAAANDMVVPIAVQFRKVKGPDICDGVALTERERIGIWTNSNRNAIIAEDARLYPESVQTLIAVKTFEHAIYLKQHLPEFTLVYGENTQTERDFAYYRKQGVLADDFVPLTRERREQLRQEFEANQLKKVIATPIWNVGVDMKYLQVVIRGDASNSRITDVQLPGRGARIATIDGQKKTCAIIHDYYDEFSHSYLRRSKARATAYSEAGWTIWTPQNRDEARLLSNVIA